LGIGPTYAQYILKEEVYALYIPTIEVSIYWMRVLGRKNDRVIIHRSHTEHILKATKMSLKRVYYIEYILALCYVSAGY
jgi:UDP-N-acetylmuramyl pentapeptide phosphotransferase/UDP-N-acetylglucosamine-1-phosphate transferase